MIFLFLMFASCGLACGYVAVSLLIDACHALKKKQAWGGMLIGAWLVFLISGMLGTISKLIWHDMFQYQSGVWIISLL